MRHAACDPKVLLPIDIPEDGGVGRPRRGEADDSSGFFTWCSPVQPQTAPITGVDQMHPTTPMKLFCIHLRCLQALLTC